MRKLLTALAATLLLAACTKVPEVGYKVWYNWPERYLPDFSALGGPDLCGQTDNFDLEDLDETRNHFCAQFESYLSVKTEEEYLFTLTTDDGSRLYVDGELLIVNDGAHGAIEKKASKILSKGRHSLRIDYFDYDKGQSMVFKYSSPSGTFSSTTRSFTAPLSSSTPCTVSVEKSHCSIESSCSTSSLPI